MPAIHPSAILQGPIHLAADDIVIGPHCILDASLGPIILGPGTRLIGNVYLTGPLTLGQGNTIYPFSTLGFPPQDIKWKPTDAGAGIAIGDNNVFRENSTVHRATSLQTPTTIGNNNYFMAGSHVAHDCRVASNVILANAALLAGHVYVDDRVIIGGGAAIHQFCRIGRGAMLSGLVGASYDVPPFFMVTATNMAGSINMIGLRRSGMPAEQIETIRWVYKTLYRRSLSLRAAVETLKEREHDPLVHEYLDFIATSRRGIVTGIGKASRGIDVQRVVDAETP